MRGKKILFSLMSEITRQIGKASRPSKGLMVVRVRPRTRVISLKSERASNAGWRSSREPIAAPVYIWRVKRISRRSFAIFGFLNSSPSNLSQGHGRTGACRADRCCAGGGRAAGRGGAVRLCLGANGRAFPRQRQPDRDVQTLNISQKLTGTLLGGKVALRIVHAVRHWANTLGCAHVMVHVTNGENAGDAEQLFRRCGMVTIGENYCWSP